VAIAPDRAGTGTNGLALRPPDAIPFHFGAGSRAAHAAAAEAANVPLTVVERPGLAFDLDTPEDLRGWLASGVLV
jgi:2-phospho-L-lactate guanylyltransferase